MKTTSQFAEPDIWRFKNYKSALRNMEILIGESEFWDNLEDPFIEKLITQMEKMNRFHNCFDVEAF
jgi:type IV secretory pathway VirB4 component